MSGQPLALRLADGVEAHAKEVEQSNGRLVFVALTLQETNRLTAELRRLHAENETLKRSVARLQQHHATAWNRGHTMGMKANENTARRALDAVKQDAWGNTQLTEALLKAEAQRDALLEFAKLVLRGCESGAIKAKPIIEMDPDAAQVDMRPLAAIARAVITKTEGT